MSPVICSYCNKEAKLVSGDVIYPHRPDLKSRTFYYCDNSHEPAYVGANQITGNPLGTLANKKLRSMRLKAHRKFDPLWEQNGCDQQFNSRSEAYQWLSTVMKLPIEKTHIGMFNEDQCEDVINHCDALIFHGVQLNFDQYVNLNCEVHNCLASNERAS